MRSRILIATLLAGSFVTASPGHADLPVISTPNLTYVASVPYKGGTDLEFQDRTVGGVTSSYLYAGSLADFSGGAATGLRVVDITNPVTPVLKSFLTCQTNQNDVQVVERGAKTYVVLGVDYGGGFGSQCYSQAGLGGSFLGLIVVDVTDVSAPKAVGSLYLRYGAHNSTMHPGGRYLYVSEAELVRPRVLSTPMLGQIQVIDLADVTKPRLVKVFYQTVGSSHDITFNADGTRAYSAALVNTISLDTTDPADPKLLAVIEDPSVSLHHQADPYSVGGRNYLIVTDELAGGGGNFACPGGGLHVFDITIETLPVKVGVFVIPEPQYEVFGRFACTSHVLRIYPQEQILTIAWYGAGTWVVDVSNPTLLRAVGHANPTAVDGRRADTWAAKMHGGYIYTNDMGRGIDVLRYEGAATPEEMGTGLVEISEAMPKAPTVGFEGGGPSPGRAMFCFEAGRPLD